jgi:hypothetical protein
MALHSLTMKKLNKTQAAKHLSVSRQTVYDLIKRGVLVTDENGLIALDDSNFLANQDGCQEETVNLTQCKGFTQSYHTIATQSPRLKDKYIASLEDRLEVQQSYIASLEQQMEFLRGELIKVQEHCKVLVQELMVKGKFWVSVLRAVITQKPETKDQLDHIFKQYQAIRQEKRRPYVKDKRPRL